MDAVKVIRLALDVLSEKVVSVLALLTGFTLAAWVMHAPEMYRLLALVVYTIFSFVITIKFRPKEVNDA